MAVPMDAEVMFDYDKTQEDELSLRVGNIIHNVIYVDVGWCEGELNGAKGMFPDNFVKILKVQPTPAPTPAVNLRNGEPERKMRRAKVIYSYVAQCEDELSLGLGKMVDIVGVDEEGWFRGRIGQNEGVFPSNFVEEEQESALPPRAASPEPAPPEIPAVDSQTGERQPPNAESRPGGVRGPMLMPAFDPTKARAQLKHSKANVGPPLEKPPEHKKPPPTASTKTIRRGKVTYDYDAENEDELTVKVGDILEIVEVEPDGQEGWVMARLRDKIGLIADVFYEVVDEQTPMPQQSPPQPKQPEKPPPPAAKEPPSKQMVPPPAQKKPETKKPPPVIPAKTESPDMDQTDFPVPKTTPLDSSAVRDRPKTKNRPPTSRSNLHSNPEEEPPAEDAGADDSTKNLPPWKLELLNKKKQPKLAPKPAGKPAASKPAKPTATSTREPVLTPMPLGRFNSMDKVTKPDPPPMARSRLNTGGSRPETNPAPPSTAPAKPAAPKPATVNKPKPPEIKSSPAPQEPPAAATLTSSSSNTTTAAPPPSASAAAAASPPTVVVDNSWKEAFEKLQGEFASFKSMVTDMVNTLTDDLDKERKQRASLEIDIDRLKKAQRSLVN